MFSKGFYFRKFLLPGFAAPLSPPPLARHPSPPRSQISSRDWQLLLQQELSTGPTCTGEGQRIPVKALILPGMSSWGG